MDMYSAIITILSVLLVSGALVLFIENQHVSSQVLSKYEFVMSSFMHKLSAYIKFVSIVASALELKGNTNKMFSSYRDRLYVFREYNYAIVMSGRDLPIDFFSASELDVVCQKINDVWYWGKQNLMSIKDCVDINNCVYDENGGSGNLKEIFDGGDYMTKSLSVKLINDVSANFFSDIYCPIKHIPIKYEHWCKRNECFKKLSVTTIILTAIGLIIILACPIIIPISYMIYWTIIMIVLYCITLIMLVCIDKLSKNIFK